MLTDRQLKRLVNKWRKRLSIEDWKLTAIKYDDTLTGEWADIEFDEYHERINLIRLRPDCPDGEEFLIVHELLHVLLRKLSGKLENEELAINKLARAFVKQKVTNPPCDTLASPPASSTY